MLTLTKQIMVLCDIQNSAGPLAIAYAENCTDDAFIALANAIKFEVLENGRAETWVLLPNGQFGYDTKTAVAVWLDWACEKVANQV